MAPEIPDDEEARRQSLERMSLLSAPDEAMFDRVTRTAQRLFGTSIASFSLIDRDRQFFKSIIGIDVRETPRDVSFCGHVVANGEMMVVPNARVDARFADNPLVTGSPDIRFYAGRPIRNSEGYTIGTLCVIDPEPREFSPTDRQSLDDLGTWLESLLLTRDLGQAQSELLAELDSTRREALIDPLLWIWNRRGIDDLLAREMARAERTGAPLTLALIDLDHFKAINDTYGHACGDAVLREAVRRMRETLRPHDILGRWGGDEFVAIGVGLPEGGEQAFGDRLCMAVGSAGPLVVGGVSIDFSITVGVAQARVADRATFPAMLLQRADEALYAAKENGRAHAAAWTPRSGAAAG